jgi:hypothetical protein
MSKSAGAWILFLAFLLLLSLSATGYSQTANMLLIAARLALLIVLSVLIVREKFRPSKDPDAGDKFLKRWRSWFYDEKHL